MLRFLEAVANIFRIPDLRRRILFTLGLLNIYRLGSFIPLPGVDRGLWETFIAPHATGMLGLLDLFTGHNLRHLSVFALSILPYAIGSVLIQASPSLEKLRQTESGRREIAARRHKLSIALGILLSLLIAWIIKTKGMAQGQPGFSFTLLTTLSLSAGTALVIWLGEQIGERGLGNGMWVIVFAGIVAGLPDGILRLYNSVFVTHERTEIELCLSIGILLVLTSMLVLLHRAERRIPVQYAKRLTGSRLMGGTSTYMPVKVNIGGVMPLIQAAVGMSCLQALWSMSITKDTSLESTVGSISTGEPLYYSLFIMAIVFFSMLSASVNFDGNVLAQNMLQHGGFIPGIRPGRNTADYIFRIGTNTTMIGAMCLSFVWLAATILGVGMKLDHLPVAALRPYTLQLPRFLLAGMGLGSPFFALALMITVVVAMDTLTELEAQLVMRHYDGFTPVSGRIRGRRSAF